MIGCFQLETEESKAMQPSVIATKCNGWHLIPALVIGGGILVEGFSEMSGREILIDQ